MAQCACGNQDLEYKTGVSKKTGKKWQGYKCTPCDLMMGMDGTPWGAKAPAKPQSSPTGNSLGNSLEKKVDEILSILKANFNTPLRQQLEKDEESIPF